MAELSKQEILLNDLGTIETQISVLAHKNDELLKANKELEKLLETLRKENMNLIHKIEELESKGKSTPENTETNLFNSLNQKERENLKIRLQGLISKIDNHLSAERQI